MSPQSLICQNVLSLSRWWWGRWKRGERKYWAFHHPHPPPPPGRKLNFDFSLSLLPRLHRYPTMALLYSVHWMGKKKKRLCVGRKSATILLLLLLSLQFLRALLCFFTSVAFVIQELLSILSSPFFCLPPPPPPPPILRAEAIRMLVCCYSASSLLLPYLQERERERVVIGKGGKTATWGFSGNSRRCWKRRERKGLTEGSQSPFHG